MLVRARRSDGTEYFLAWEWMPRGSNIVEVTLGGEPVMRPNPPWDFLTMGEVDFMHYTATISGPAWGNYYENIDAFVTARAARKAAAEAVKELER